MRSIEQYLPSSIEDVLAPGLIGVVNDAGSDCFRNLATILQANSLLSRTRTGMRQVAVALALGLVAISASAASEPISLPGDRVFPESITSTSDGTLYVGSIANGGVLRVPPHGSPEVWIKPGAFGTGSIFGVLADERSNTLWACANDLSAMGIRVASAAVGSSLKGFDLKTGKGKISATLPGDKALCNDIAVGPDGSVFVTNTYAPEVLRLGVGAEQLEVWFTDPLLQPPTGAGLDGIAFGSDGNLYLDRYTPADLYRIDIANGKAGKLTQLHPSRGLVLADAIRPLDDNTFLLIEGGGSVDVMKITGDTADIETIKDGYAVPTGVTQVGPTAWVSEGQLNYIFDPTKKEQKPTLPFRLYSVPIPK